MPGQGSEDDIDAAVLADLEARSGDHGKGPFLKAYRDWLNGGPAVDSPRALLVISGVPETMLSFSIAAFAIRDRFIAEFGYAIPTTDFPRAFEGLGPVLEIGAGRGYLSALLRQAGIDAIATDRDPAHLDGVVPITSDPGEMEKITPVDCPVEVMEATAAIKAHPGRTVLCSWPSYQESWLTQAALAMAPGQVLAVIGEDDGGCTADASFFELISNGTLLPLDDEARGETAATAIWSFPGIHDRLRFFTKA